MDKTILVAYGSKRGSTAEIAGKIGEALRRKGLKADVRAAGSVTDIAAYDAVLLGSSVYIGLWHKSAAQLLKKNAAQLSGLPVWLFISGPTGPGDPLEHMNGWLYPKALAPVIGQIKPREITCFGGKIVRQELNPFEKWIINKVKAPEGDFRDWAAITAWADGVAGALGPV